MAKHLNLTMEQRVKIAHAELIARTHRASRPLKRKDAQRDVRWLRWINENFLEDAV